MRPSHPSHATRVVIARSYTPSLHTSRLVWPKSMSCASAAVKLNGNRHVTGVLRGFDQFMNVVIDDAVEQASATERNNIGMVVRFRLWLCMP